MAQEKDTHIDLKAVEMAINGVWEQLNAIPNNLLNEHERKYKLLKMRQLKALNAFASETLCPETWGIWPEQPQEAKE